VFKFSQEAINLISGTIENIGKNMACAYPTVDSIYLASFLTDTEDDVKFLAVQLSRHRSKTIVEKQDANDAAKKLVLAIRREQKLLHLDHKQALGIINILKEKTQSSPNLTVLDVGCGWGKASRKLAKHVKKELEIVGVDIDILSLRYGKSLSPNTSFLRSHMEYLPLRSHVCDVVLSRNALHEIEDDKDRDRSLEEIRRVLKQEGVLHVHDPFSRFHATKLIQRFQRLIFPRMECYALAEEFEKSLKKAGFKVVLKNCFTWSAVSLARALVFCSYIAVMR
jgi:ubiquinone/menaquinone biosynthesis C-methylase UbiE